MPFKNKQDKRDFQRKWMQQRRKQRLASMGGKCIKCGSTEHLELDHIDPSTKVTHKIWSWSHKRFIEEAAKCQLLCYSCHKVKTKKDLSNIGKKRDHTRPRNKLGQYKPL